MSVLNCSFIQAMVYILRNDEVDLSLRRLPQLCQLHETCTISIRYIGSESRGGFSFITASQVPHSLQRSFCYWTTLKSSRGPSPFDGSRTEIPKPTHPF